MKHSIEEVNLKNGARGLLIDAPGSSVMNIRVIFRAGNKFVKKPEIYEVAHLMEHMAFGRNELFKDMSSLPMRQNVLILSGSVF